MFYIYSTSHGERQKDDLEREDAEVQCLLGEG